MNNRFVKKNIYLSYQLTDYLISHPNTSINKNDENIIIFTNDDKEFNKFNIKLLHNLIQQYKNIVIALTDSNNKNNLWSFDTASKKNIPDIPYIQC